MGFYWTFLGKTGPVWWGAHGGTVDGCGSKVRPVCVQYVCGGGGYFVAMCSRKDAAVHVKKQILLLKARARLARGAAGEASTRRSILSMRIEFVVGEFWMDLFLL